MIKIHKADGNPRHDDMTEAQITVNGVYAGELVSDYANTNPCDWYSKASQRVVTVTAAIWIGEDQISKTIHVYEANRRGHLFPTGTTSRQARSELIKWIRRQLS